MAYYCIVLCLAAGLRIHYSGMDGHCTAYVGTTRFVLARRADDNAADGQDGLGQWILRSLPHAHTCHCTHCTHCPQVFPSLCVPRIAQIPNRESGEPSCQALSRDEGDVEMCEVPHAWQHTTVDLVCVCKQIYAKYICTWYRVPVEASEIARAALHGIHTCTGPGGLRHTEPQAGPCNRERRSPRTLSCRLGY